MYCFAWVGFYMESKILAKVAVISELPTPGTIKEFLFNGRFVCIANIDGELCATESICPHWGGPIGQGTIEHGKIVCPWHRWEYDPKTGKTSRRNDVRLTIYKLRIEGNDVLVEL